MLTDTDDLVTQARELVAHAVAEKRIILNRDQPWKVAARKLMNGQDIRVGQLTEIFRALGEQPRLVKGICSLRLKTGDRIFFHEMKYAVTMTTLLTTGKAVTGDGAVITLTKEEREQLGFDAPTGPN